MVFKTYLVMYFGTEGDSNMTEIVKRVEEIGFKSALGPVDFVYEWDHEPSKKEIFHIGNKLLETLKGANVIFNLDTHE